MTLLTAGVVTVCVTLLTAGVVSVSSVMLLGFSDSHNMQIPGTVHKCFASMELVTLF